MCEFWECPPAARESGKGTKHTIFRRTVRLNARDGSEKQNDGRGQSARFLMYILGEHSSRNLYGALGFCEPKLLVSVLWGMSLYVNAVGTPTRDAPT